MADAVRDYGAKVTVAVQLENPQEVVIPKRGMFARRFCCSAAGSKHIPRRQSWRRNDKGLVWVVLLLTAPPISRVT